MRSQRAYFEGDGGIIVLCTLFLISSSISVPIFHITWLDIFWTDLVYSFFLYIYTFSCNGSTLWLLSGIFELPTPLLLGFGAISK